MERDDYLRALRSTLDTHTAAVSERLRRIAEVAAGPDGARVTGVVIDVFPDQDGEGAFDVMARFEGPDSYVLNRPIDDVRRLFGVVHGEGHFEPDVPALTPGRESFDPEQAMLEAVTEWIEAILPVEKPLPFEVTLAPCC